MHHMMFGLWYYDYGAIIEDFLPLMKNGYDIFFNGHEHQLNYAYTPAQETLYYKIPWYRMYQSQKEVCHNNQEVFSKDEDSLD